MTRQLHEHNRRAFISYRRSDGPAVEQIIKALGPDYPTWRDTSDIRGGQVWREEIVRAIDSAYALILVISSRTEESKEVYAEYFYALGRKVPIIPLLIAETNLPFGLENLNARFWYRNPAQALKDLITDLDYYRFQAPALEPAHDKKTYLSALQFNYLMAVKNYTPMAGVARFRPSRTAGRLNPVVMGSEFVIRKCSKLYSDKQVPEEVRSYEDLLPALHQLNQVLILGEPGIGKTTTLLKFADELRRRALQDPAAPVPVIVPLGEWRKDVAWKEFITPHLGGLPLRYEQLQDSPGLHLLLDGLNEIPRDKNRQKKLSELKQMLAKSNPAAITCRELDYRDEAIRLESLDTITIHPLAPERVREFLRRYLIDLYEEVNGGSKAEDLFWQIAGGAEVKAIWEKWRHAGASLNLFFSAPDIPRESPAVISVTDYRDRELWRRVVKSPTNLVHLAANPYLLWMFLNIYLQQGTIPSNRGALFDDFVFQLFKREGLTVEEQLTTEGNHLSDALEEVAWCLQTEVGEASSVGRDVKLTLPRSDVIQILGAKERLYRAASANLLEDAEPVRFTHQLLQEYFAAKRMLKEISLGRLDARKLWPAERWWQPRGWEEIAVLAAGMKVEEIIEWLLPVNPEVAALAINRSGVVVGDQLKLKLRTLWLSRLTDVSRYPKAVARRAIGCALGSLTLSSGEVLDNRPGVGLTANRLPDIDWVEIPGGTVMLEGVKGEFKVAPFRIARYPVTNCQFKAFEEAADGHRNKELWRDIRLSDSPYPSNWKETNCPRETVSWYEAVAFCRWLTRKYHQHKLLETGKEIRLPAEWEWQQAATGGNPEKTYPWGPKWDAGKANTYESDLSRTTAVGMYPHGTWPDGPLDLSGNVWEWCLNEYGNPKRVEISGEKPRALRGGSWYNDQHLARCADRSFDHPDYRDDGIGFRVVCAPPIF